MVFEVTGDMLIMALAHAQVSGDGSLLVQHVRTATFACHDAVLIPLLV